MTAAATLLIVCPFGAAFTHVAHRSLQHSVPLLRCQTPCATPLPRWSRQQHARRCSLVVARGDSRRSLASRVDGSTKYLVAGAQLWALAARRDALAPFIVLGMVCASFLCSALKRVIGAARPGLSGAAARASDPGMPSAHALVSAFAATAWSCALGSQRAAIGLSALAAAIGVLRVVCGWRTAEQVVVGLALGVGCALGWTEAGKAAGVFALAPASPAANILRASCALAVLLFVARKAAKFAPG